MIKHARVRNCEILTEVLVQIDFEVGGFPCFVYYRKSKADFKATEYRSGLTFGFPGKTVQDCIDFAREQYEQKGPDKFRAAIEKAIAQYGEMPA